MATCLLTILFIMVKRDSFLLVSSDFHVRSSSRSVTLDLLWYRYLTNLAPLRWTISILLISTLSCGSQTQLANSTVGLTIYVYAVSLVLVYAIFKFLLKNPMALFALVVTEVITMVAPVQSVVGYTSKILGIADMWKNMVIETVCMMN